MAVPEAPTPMQADQIEMRSFRYRFSGNWGGGLEILQFQVGYGTHPTSVQKSVDSWGATVIKGLQPGTRYYVWVRARNAQGWSLWSSRISVQTTAGARVRYKGSWHYAVPYVRYNGKWRIAEPWVRRAGKWRKTNNE